MGKARKSTHPRTASIEQSAVAEEQSAVAEEPRAVQPRKLRRKSGPALRTSQEVKDDMIETAERRKASRAVAKGCPRSECYGGEPIRGGGVCSVEPPAGPRAITSKREGNGTGGSRCSKVDVAASSSRAVPQHNGQMNDELNWPKRYDLKGGEQPKPTYPEFSF